MTEACAHYQPGIEIEPPLDVCPVCVAMGATWVHLRQCLGCGQTRCCNDSPNRHAFAHFRETGHPMIRTAEPDEDWLWCFADDLPYVPGPTGYVAVSD